MSHTAGKLKITGKWIQSENGRGVAHAGCPYMDDEDSRRMVACWNAFDGMPQDDIEELAKMPNAVVNLAFYADNLEQERDELLKVLREERAAWDELKSFSEMRKMHDACDAILARYPEGKS